MGHYHVKSPSEVSIIISLTSKRKQKNTMTLCWLSKKRSKTTQQNPKRFLQLPNVLFFLFRLAYLSRQEPTLLENRSSGIPQMYLTPLFRYPTKLPNSPERRPAGRENMFSPVIEKK